ncbi:hypothetical protein CALCODRAFT_500417 [Calocera cornea HHB12733]|uniref:Uncharacterized protein n=1 Tax=Calocera cornea HHB12733 TaxID=1353952 RepID=A0A165E2J0_9BASI|nr:hypothetical protein CALCODRAFT_500417 [Calocera cornea HHB12733]
MSSVMGSLAHEPVWLSLMHAALIVEMPLVIACTVENRFLQQPKPPPTLASLTLTRTLLLHLLTALLLLTSLTALLSRPSCAPGSPWLESLRPAVVNQGEEETEVMRANCTESLVAVGLTLGNTALCKSLPRPPSPVPRSLLCLHVRRTQLTSRPCRSVLACTPRPVPPHLHPRGQARPLANRRPRTGVSACGDDDGRGAVRGASPAGALLAATAHGRISLRRAAGRYDVRPQQALCYGRTLPATCVGAILERS